MIAQDVQGSEAALPWVEKAGGTYGALLDKRNLLGKAYGVKFVPIGIIIDENGELAWAVGSLDIGEKEFHDQLTRWVVTNEIPQEWRAADRSDSPPLLTTDEQEADVRMQLAVVLLDRGRDGEALAELKQAARLDPENWFIRKQMWALETPDAFYAGDVDYDWQKEQMAREGA